MLTPRAKRIVIHDDICRKFLEFERWNVNSTTFRFKQRSEVSAAEIQRTIQKLRIVRRTNGLNTENVTV